MVGSHHRRGFRVLRGRTARAAPPRTDGLVQPHPGAGICGPTTVTSGMGCNAHWGGSIPTASAARRAQWRSNPGRCADEHVARGHVAVIGERMGHVARGEGDFARTLGHECVLDLEEQLALEHVEGLVEVVRVQRGAGIVRRDHDSVTETWSRVSSPRSRTSVRGLGAGAIGQRPRPPAGTARSGCRRDPRAGSAGRRAR